MSQQTTREQEVASAAQAAARSEKAGWKEAASVATQKKEEAQMVANKAEQEAENLKLKTKQKEDEAFEARSQAATLEGHEADIHAKAVSAGRSPGLMDRVKASFQGVKESIMGAKDDAQRNVEETGETVKEKFASMKQTAGEKMEEVGGKIAGKGQETQETAAAQRGEAIARKTDLQQSKENERARAHESEQLGSQLKPGVTSGDTSASFKETAAAQAEKAAAMAADKAKELQGRAAQVRKEAQAEK